MGPLAYEAGEKVLVLGELHLELAFAGAGVSGEYVEDEGGAVDDLFAQLFFQVALLGGAECVVEDYDICLKLALEVADFFQFALADVERGGLFESLVDGGGYFSAGGAGELGEFVQGGVEAPGAAAALESDADEEGAFGVVQGP